MYHLSLNVFQPSSNNPNKISKKFAQIITLVGQGWSDAVADILPQSVAEGQNGCGYKPLTQVRQSPSVSNTPIQGIES